MKIVFRTDASIEIGTGHVMRCLTLADALKAKGAECHFVCRRHPGNLINYIGSRAHHVHSLQYIDIEEVGGRRDSATGNPIHGHWLGCTQAMDAAECSEISRDLQPDWLIVDHYALDISWETALKPYSSNLMVIDDLADRPHMCDLLLDQTFGRNPQDYTSLVSPYCKTLCGSRYALIRPEFSENRSYSLSRRKTQEFKRLLITMGGVDKDNATGEVLKALNFCDLPDVLRVSVVMGAGAPRLHEIHQLAAQMKWSTEVLVNINDVALLMADSDLAIGAAGTTSWERCCLGLPSVIVVLADNQQLVATGLEQAGAVQVIKNMDAIKESLPHLLPSLVSSPSLRETMSNASARITDGSGVKAILQYLEY